MPPPKRALSQPSLAAFLGGGTGRSPKRRAEPDTDIELQEALQASRAAAQEQVVCPLCAQSFSSEEIQRHASGCGDPAGDEAVEARDAEAVCTSFKSEIPSCKSEEGNALDADADADVDADACVDPCADDDEPDTLASGPPTEASSSTKPSHDTPPSFLARLWGARKTDDAPPKAYDTKGRMRRAPFYKVLEGMPIAVDAFSYGAIDGCVAYVLTHFHSDHYGGLSRKWTHGPIYCSSPTARLVCTKLGVDAQYVHALPMDTPVRLPGTEVHVTLIDANHCPGACILLFEGRQTTRPAAPMRTYRYLHCGDFRACPQQLAHPALQQGVDLVYLDTTYLNPRYCFPAQPEVIDACVELVKTTVQGHKPRKQQATLSWNASRAQAGAPADVLVVVGTYSIGKEKLVLALARALQTSIYCVDARKYDVYAQLEDAELTARLTRDPTEARVHVTNLFALSPDALRTWAETLRARGMPITHTLAFRPTGWSFRGGDRGVVPDAPLAAQVPKLVPPRFDCTALTPTRDSTADTQVYSVPYSEHSSFYELTAFMTALPHQRTIPTVNVGSEAARARMRRWTDAWLRVVRRQAGAPLIAARSTLYY